MIPGNINTALISGAEGGGYQIQRSLRFNSSDSVFLSRTPASAGNRKTFTWAGWVKRSNIGGANPSLFGCQSGAGNPRDTFLFASDQLTYDANTTGSAWNVSVKTTQVFRDASAWYHIVLAVDTTQATAANRVRLYVNGSEVTAFATATYPAQNTDLPINQAQIHYLGASTGSNFFDGYLADVHFIDGQALTPSSFTEVSATTGQLIPKQYTGSFGTNGFWLKFSDNSAATATTLGKDYSGNSNNWTPNNLSVALDQNYIAAISATGASIDTAYAPVTNGFDNNSSTFFRTTGGSSGTPATIIFAPQQPITITSSLVFRGYIGGNQGYSVQIGSTTLASGASDPSGNADWTVPGASGRTISKTTPLKLSANNTGAGGEGVWWNYLSVDGSQLVFSSSSIGASDSTVDTPTSYGTDTGAGGEVRGNYCTWNPLISTSGPISNGNLEMVGANAWRNTKGTISVSTGKWYFEATYTGSQYGSALGNLAAGVGFCKSNTTTPNVDVNDSSLYGSILAFSQTGHVNNFNAPSSARSQIASGDVIGFALNYDTGTYTIYVNNTSTSSGSLNFTGELTPWTNAYYSGSYFILNAGQRPFAYTAPSGFKALVDTNLAAPVVAKSSDYFQTVLYTGNGSSRTISGLGFSPDLVWIKPRSVAEQHELYNTISGPNKALFTDYTDAETTITDNGLNAFNPDGFSLGSRGYVNGSGKSYVAWCWDAGSSTVTNTQGSITSQVRANASAGFSIVTWTNPSTANQTIGHGLNVKPAMIIRKYRNNADGWVVYHTSLGQSSGLFLNTTGAASADANLWPGSINSTVFSTGNLGYFPDGWTAVAYCFAPVAGYSSFGSYTGNGSADGPFVYTGFRVKWYLVKQSSASGENWRIIDATRSPYNVAQDRLLPNSSAAEAVQPNEVDFLSNGFKFRSADGAYNASGATYIYAAFAESPFQYARAR